MKKLIIICISIILISSCNHKPQGASINSAVDSAMMSDEEKGCKDIENSYGGKCKYSTRVMNGKKYIEVEISKSDSVEKGNMENLFFSIAYQFYTNLGAKERSKYEEMRIVLVYADKHKGASDFYLNGLEIVEQKMPLVKQNVKLLQENNYEGIEKSIGDSSLKTLDKTNLTDALKDSIILLGNISAFEFQGYSFEKSNKGYGIIQIFGLIHGNRKSHSYSVAFQDNEDKNQIHGIIYQLPSSKGCYFFTVKAPKNTNKAQNSNSGKSRI